MQWSRVQDALTHSPPTTPIRRATMGLARLSSNQDNRGPDGDGVVSSIDLLEFLSLYGEGC